MYPRSVLALKYLRYYCTAANSRGHGVHSPFVFNFIKHILRDASGYDAYQLVALKRRSMLRDHSTVLVNDFGAGSVYSNDNERRVSSIARHALKPSKYAHLLFRMVRYFQPSVILELGTSLGTTTALLAMAAPRAGVVTMEGSPAIADIASRNFKSLHIGNISQIAGNFDLTLPQYLATSPVLDFIFLDGNHRYAPTMNYFNLLLPHVHEYTIIVMDDIHWSAGMEKAWQECRNHPSVTLSIDLFFIGILFFRKEFLIKQHFTIRF